MVRNSERRAKSEGCCIEREGGVELTLRCERESVQKNTNGRAATIGEKGKGVAIIKAIGQRSGVIYNRSSELLQK